MPDTSIGARFSWGRRARWLAAAALATATTAHAGMTSYSLTDVARMRIEVISFFLLAYFLCGWVFQFVWNRLGKDWPRLPRLGYWRAMGVVVVCGLFCYVVLTMIAGARELMTPGAWIREGVAYRLRDPEQDPKTWLTEARRDSLRRLRTALWRYAAEHGGAFPAKLADLPGAAELSRSSSPSGDPFLYHPGLTADNGHSWLAAEPESYGRKRLALYSDGQIEWVDPGEFDTPKKAGQ